VNFPTSSVVVDPDGVPQKQQRMKNNEDYNSEELFKALKQIKETVPCLLESIQQLAGLSSRTPGEEEELQKLLGIFDQLKWSLSDLRDYLDGKLFDASLTFYCVIKEKAAAGDVQAQKIVDDLGPWYQQILIDQVNRN